MRRHIHILHPEDRAPFEEHREGSSPGGHLMGVLGQLTTMLLWVIGFLALVQTMTAN